MCAPSSYESCGLGLFPFPWGFAEQYPVGGI
jgi:hypothetical protein